MNRVFRKFILFTLFLVACQSTNPIIPASPISSPLPSPTTEIPIATQALTAIPAITSAPFDRDTRVVDLPKWIKYSSFPNGILALPYGDINNDRPSKVIFVNPDNGVTFVVDLQKEFYHYYWRDRDHIVFFHEGDCSGSPKFISELIVFNGSLQRYEAKTHPEYILDCYPNPNNEIARLNYEFSERVVEFVDPSSREVFQLTNPSDGVTDISIKLSPYDDFLAVVQFKGDFEFPKSQSPIFGNQISVFDLGTQRLILKYTEEQGILSEVSFIDYSNLVYMRGNTPCLIMILSQVKKCIHNVPNRFPDSTIILTKNSEGSRTFGFLYFSQNQGGYCFYDIYTGGLGCATDRFSIFNNQFVINYSLSSFGHYVLLEYSSDGCPIPLCDYPENTNLALIDFHEGELFELGSSDSYYLSGLFRPLHPDPWQPWR
ncbi:MAG: hypothetical protein ABI904_23190 [Chloroflexota bacterium]